MPHGRNNEVRCNRDACCTMCSYTTSSHSESVTGRSDAEEAGGGDDAAVEEGDTQYRSLIRCLISRSSSTVMRSMFSNKPYWTCMEIARDIASRANTAKASFFWLEMKSGVVRIYRANVAASVSVRPAHLMT